MLTTLRVRVFSRPFRLVGALAAVVALLALSMVIPPSSSVPVVRAADSGTAVTKTLPASGKPLVDGKGKPYPSSVTVSQTTNLQQRQVISVSWKGFEPSHNYRLVPPEGGADKTEFPVALVECWGKDTPDTPMDPSQCQRVGGPQALVKNWQYNAANDPAYPNPTDTSPKPADVRTGRPQSGAFLGFTAVDGRHYTSDGTSTLAPDLNGNGAVPNNSVLTYSDANGSRSNVEFEVRGGQDVPVLGCSDQKACTLEVVPILQPYCKPGTDAYSKAYCPLGPRTPVGQGTSPYVNPVLLGDMWWLGTQWKNRFAFDLSMAPLPGECTVVDQRPTVSVEGSEAPSPVMALWSQHFCFDPNSPFKVTHSFGVTEDTARRNLVTQGPDGYVSNGIFTSLPVTGSPRPVVHAPVAVTGWTIAYKIDDYTTKTMYENLTLSPLLLAKLITSSYTHGAGPPAVAGNPADMFQDPEFKALNPNLHPPLGIKANVVWDQLSSDAFAAMFAYIDADPEARAWLDGKPDAYSGMVVNPAFRGQLKSPQTVVQYLDGWVKYHPDPVSDYSIARCEHDDPKPWYGFEKALTQTSLDATAKAVLNRNAQEYVCQNPPFTNLARWGKASQPQPIGTRGLIAFTTVPLAERYGLSMAKLQSHTLNSKAVGPSGWENPTKDPNRFDTLGPALGYMKQDKDTGVASPDFGVFPYNNPYAYPGVLPVYAAIPTCGLDPTLAGRYADFLEFAAGAGQTLGLSGGQLPWGYTPLPKAYADYTKTAATAVRNQKCEVPAPPQDLSPQVRNDAGLPAPGTPDDQLPTSAPNGKVSPGAGNPNSGKSAPGAGKSVPSSVAGRPSPAAATSATDSWLDAWGLVILLVVGLVAGLAVPVVRVAGQPGHPVRRFFAGLGQRQPPMVGRKPDVTADAPAPTTNHDGQEKR